jgi:hypothetical protein
VVAPHTSGPKWTCSNFIRVDNIKRIKKNDRFGICETVRIFRVGILIRHGIFLKSSMHVPR